MGLLDRLRRPVAEAYAAPTAAPVEEAAGPGPVAVTRLGYEYGVPKGGTDSVRARALGSQRQQQMDELYQAYLACPWSSTCIDTVARTVTAGGLRLVPEDGDADQTMPPDVAAVDRLLRYTNPREDAIQLLRSTVTDLLIFGDGFIEVRELLGVPAGLWTLDATTMSVNVDEHGEVTGYTQDVDATRSATFDASEVIHVSLDAPRGGIYGVSPTQKLLVSITAWLFAEACIKEAFRRGDPPTVAVDLGRSTSVSDAQRWLEQYMVANIGPRAIGMPIVTRVHAGNGGDQPPIKELSTRKIADYLAAAKQLRDEIISGYGMTPANVGVIESGNLGGGTGESQARALHYNTVVPIQNLLLEKLTYRLLTARGITGWRFEFGEVDYRDSATIEQIRNLRLTTGPYSLNRYMAEIGEEGIGPAGDVHVLVTRQGPITWDNLQAMSDAQTQAAQAGALAAAEPTVPAVDAPSNDGQAAADDPGGADDATPGTPPTEAVRDARALSEAWRHAYRARRRQALRDLPPVGS